MVNWKNWTDGRQRKDQTYGEIFRNRYLDERARLEFYYPDDTIMFMPFYENPTIMESQTANYVEYNPIARAGSLYAYTGAKSRKIKIEIIFTLPHLAMHNMGIDRFRRIFANTTKESQRLLFTQFSKFSKQPKPGDVDTSLSTEVEKVWIDLFRAKNYKGVTDRAEELQTSQLGQLLGLQDLPIQEMKELQLPPKERHQILDTMLFFVALLRTSVTNNATNPIMGPPLIRINFGTLYQSVPCICKNYNLEWEDDAGFDLGTLTPRQLKITIDLVEVRTGDFGTYEPATLVKRDNITGWESAINSPHTTDPLNIDSYGKGTTNQPSAGSVVTGMRKHAEGSLKQAYQGISSALGRFRGWAPPCETC